MIILSTAAISPIGVILGVLFAAFFLPWLRRALAWALAWIIAGDAAVMALLSNSTYLPLAFGVWIAIGLFGFAVCLAYVAESVFGYPVRIRIQQATIIVRELAAEYTPWLIRPLAISTRARIVIVIVIVAAYCYWLTTICS